jgi:phage terminase Nu1 subunit (DNA packaging protein)
MNEKGVGLVKTADLCEFFGVSRQAVYRWRKDGCPSVINSGRFIRYDLDKVITWLKHR